jgi:autotransporter adhesin
VKLGNVADGTAPNDAVNRGQLDTVSATANKGWNLSANGEGTPQKIAPGDTVDFIDGSNTTVSRTGNQIKVDVSKTPTFDSVTVGSGTAGTPGTSATLGANGLTTIGTDGKAGPSVTTAGIDAGGKPITNVGAGTNGTDAANVAQVKECASQGRQRRAVRREKRHAGQGKRDAWAARTRTARRQRPCEAGQRGRRQRGRGLEGRRQRRPAEHHEPEHHEPGQQHPQRARSVRCRLFPARPIS